MTIQTITSYRFIPGKESSITTYGSPDEQTVAIHNSLGTTVSLTFTIENMLVLEELIRDLGKVYRNFINTKKEYIEEEFSYELDEI